MKLLKKFLAAALAGAVALTLLAGCSHSITMALDEKELVAIMNDIDFAASSHMNSNYGVNTYTVGDSTLAKQAFAKAKTYAETNHVSGDEVLNGFRYDAENEYYDWQPYGRFKDKAGIYEIIPKDCPDAYCFTYLRLSAFQSKEFQQNYTAHLAQLLARRCSVDPMNSIPKDALTYYSTSASVSAAIGTIDGTEYLVIVFVQKAGQG